MLSGLLEKLAAVILAVISATGYVGIAGLIAIKSACIPLPSEIIMPFSGYLVSTGRFNLIAVATVGAIGCNLGSTLAYYAGAYGGRAAVERWGRFVLIRPHDIDGAERFFKRFGTLTVFVSRLLPVVRTFIALPAGFVRMPQLQFQIYTFAGSWLWCFALAFLGMKLGERWETDPTVRAIFHQADMVIVALLAAAASWFVWRRFKRT